MKIKQMTRTIIYVIILCFILSKIGFLFSLIYTKIGYFEQATTQRELYDIKNNTIEVVFTGDSKSTCGIDPVDIYKKSGIKSFNRANYASPLLDSYYMTVETLKRHNVKYVFLEASQIFNKNVTNRLFPTITDDLGLKAKFYIDKDSPEFKRFYLCNMSNIYLFHTRWKNLEVSDFDKLVNPQIDKSYFRGSKVFVETGKVKIKELEEKRKAFKNNGDKKLVIDPHNMNILKRFKNLCDENNVEFYIYLIPTIGDYREDYKKLQLEKISFENDIKYLDLKNKININNQTDYSDQGNHYNYLGMQKVDDYFVDFLKNDKTLNRDKDVDWDKKVKEEEKYIKNQKEKLKQKDNKKQGEI